MKVFSIIVLSLLVAVLVGLAIYILFGGICYRMALSKKGVIKKRSTKNFMQNVDKYMVDLDWWQDKPFETLTITSGDGLKLCGHFLQKEGDRLAIVVHGYGGDYRETYNYAKMFYKRGYSILAVECRAHGNSEGNMVGMGWLDRLDILKWIEYMLSQNSDYKIALFGLSMGGAAVCMSLGEKLPNNVICAISDCGFDNVYREFSYIFTRHTHMPAKFVMSFFNSYVKRTKHFDMKNADAVRQLKKAKIPVLFIHGEKDTFVPTEMVYKLADAVPEYRREIYVVNGAGHAMSYPTDPKEYEKRVDKFLRKYNM